jgi:hypothetical protein
MGTQPPPLPSLNFEPVLKVFEFQDNLNKMCDEKNSLYIITAQEYNETLCRVQCVEEKFSKGKILTEMEKMIEEETGDYSSESVEDMLQDYYQSRKRLNKMKILKELYLDS